jgi:hypothetical protein
MSFADLLLGRSNSVERDALYWHYPHSRHEGAVREGKYKLLHRFKSGRVELYNLKDDPGEQNDLNGEHPKLAARLLSKLKQWQKSVGARFDPSTESQDSP